MLKDKPSWLKPVASTYAPGCIVSIVCDVEHVDTKSGIDLQYFTLKRIHVQESHRRSVHWSSPEYRSFESGLQLIDWLESTRSTRRRTYVFCHDLMNTLALMSIFDVFEASGCKHAKDPDAAGSSAKEVGGPAPDHPTDPANETQGSTCSDGLYHFTRFTPGINAQIVSYTKNGRAYQWCGHAQYCQSAEHSVAQSIRYQWHNLAEYPAEQPNAFRTCSDRALMWLRFYQQLCDWWIDVDGGPWGATVASMSYSFLRRRLKPKTILLHTDEQCGQLESQAIFGGRRSIWYVGNIGSEDKWQKFSTAAPSRSPYGTIDSTLVNHDIRSMYPHILANNQFPVRQLEYIPKPSNAAVIDALKHYGVIAHCVLKTELPEYPKRTDTGIQYPVGIFGTTLCGDELKRALDRREVLYINGAAVYIMGKPFEEPCRELIDHRIRARLDDRPAWELFVKMLANSMSGRIAMVPHEWIERTDVVPPMEWGLYREKCQDSREWKNYKVHMGLVWERVIAEQNNRPMGAAYAYLTSYGRSVMWALRYKCPVETVIAQDTDGLWTTAAAVPYLYTDYVDACSPPGELALKHVSSAGRFFGPQHYWFGDGWIISGSNVVNHRPKSENVLVREKLAAVRGSMERPIPCLVEKTMERDIGRIMAYGDVSDDGWIQPNRMWTMTDDSRTGS